MKAFFRFLFSVRTIMLVLLVLALVGGGWYLWQLSTANAGKSDYRTDVVKKGSLSATISATGTLEPQQVIDVGAQVAGLVLKFAPADPANPNGPVVDYCTVVKPGQVLAYIDPTIYQAQVNQAKASLQNAQANVKKSQANAAGMKDTYQRDMGAGTAAINAGQIATDKAAYEAAEADIGVQEAAVAQAEANLKLAQTNLDYCTIKAPPEDLKDAADKTVAHNYTIVDRRVSIGQTVVASLSAPSLFLLAKDLMKMQIWASVNEADIGNIHVGEAVSFTVDARPGKTYEGTVSQIRLNASMTQNVVTYTVVVDTDNRWRDAPTTPAGHHKNPGDADKGTTSGTSDQAAAPSTANDTAPGTSAKELELLPYLTANLTFHVARRDNVLQIPNAALRWRPQIDKVDPKYKDEYEKSLRKKGSKDSSDGGDSAEAPKGAPAAAAPAAAAPGAGDNKPAKPHERQAGAANRGMVWVQDGAYVRPIKIVTGLTDGAMTEVVSAEEGVTLVEGAELVTGENAGKSGSTATTNPFAPKISFGQQQPKKDDQQQK